MPPSADSSAERKGLIYEAFVAVAVQLTLGSRPELGTKLKGVAADQDVIWPSARSPKLVISVTHWGSHEAAKMKFWRIHEDFFEVREALPKTVFLSVVFDRNANSDANLCVLLDEFFGSGGISDLNCAAIKELQAEVSSEQRMARFGSGGDTIHDKVLDLSSHDLEFRAKLTALGKSICDKFKHFSPDKNLRAQWAGGVGRASRKFREPSDRETNFKPAIICLLDIGAHVTDVFAADGKWGELSLDLVSKLVRNGALEEDPYSLDAEDYVVTPVFKQLLCQGEAWCARVLTNVQKLVSDPVHPLHAYHDHVLDVTDRGSCAARLSRLLQCQTPAEILKCIDAARDPLNRCWPIDYTTAIQRAHVLAGEYGLQRMSEAARIKYVAGGISPLPRFLAGQLDALTVAEKRRLAEVIVDLKKGWSAVKATPETVQRDRKITLMKKLPALDVVLESSFREILPESIFRGARRVRHPVSCRARNKAAGATDYNLMLESKGRRAWIFVAATYESTHKHKELAGRLRAAKCSGEVRPKDLPVLLIDGNLLSGNDRRDRVQMLKRAGWAGAYFLDEIDEMASDLRSQLHC